jgi:hypothetical protein
MAPKRKAEAKTTNTEVQSKKRTAKHKDTPQDNTIDKLVATVSSLSDKVAQLQETVVALSSNSAQHAPAHLISESPTPSPAKVALGSLPTVNVLPPQIKTDIRAGKNINLASLLIAVDSDENPVGTTRTIEIGGESINLKPLKDSRLTRMLTVPEFIRAFGIYREEVCQVSPERRHELDSYMDYVVNLSHSYDGGVFYNYHLKFSKKAAYYKTQLNVDIDWSQPDSGIRNDCTSGKKARACGLCDSLDHATHFCHLAASPHKTGNTNDICYRFNSAKGCLLPKCNFQHICKACNSKQHGSTTCKDKPNQTYGGQANANKQNNTRN